MALRRHEVMMSELLRMTGIREEVSLTQSPSKTDPNLIYDLVTGLEVQWEVRAELG